MIHNAQIPEQHNLLANQKFPKLIQMRVFIIQKGENRTQ